MKIIIITAIALLIYSTPCLAQEIELQGLPTLNNTIWTIPCETEIHKCPYPNLIGFSDNDIYFVIPIDFLTKCSSSVIINLGVVSFYKATCNPIANQFVDIAGLASPVMGIGINIMNLPPSKPVITKIVKSEASWSPEPTFSIWPYEAEQGATLIYVYIGGTYTSFKDDGVTDISFIPPDGIRISNISVKTNNTIELDLEIASDAPVGFKTIIITLDEGNQVMIGNDLFEVRENIQ